MIARKEFQQLDHLFFKTLWQSVSVCAAGAFVVWVAVVYLNWAQLPFSRRVLDPISMGLLLESSVLNSIINAEALYLRAHKQEKFLFNSVLGALLVAPSTYFLGRSYGAFGMVAGSLALGLFLGLPLATYTFLKYRRIWHVQ
jgi:hypothetical protein